MRIVIDDKIPFIQPALRLLADEVVALPGTKITESDVHDADILVVRTRTRCNRELLEGSRIRLVLTATIGYDHIDTAYMRQVGIEWHNCPGCNANSVAQYVHSCLILMQQERGLNLPDATIGIVGVGHVGKAVLRWIMPMGFKRILLCDPPLEKANIEAPDGYEWSSLEQLKAEADILTLHVPLTLNGLHPTFHLIDSTYLNNRTKPLALINAARGGVVDESALLKSMAQGKVNTAIIDTWETEPQPNLPLLDKVYIGTPHIAGYSADGKANASRMCVEAICRHIGREMPCTIEAPALPEGYKGYDPSRHLSANSPLFYYDPRRDSALLKAAPETFEQLRGNYPLRRE
ncbi:MAG: 4-phosphoerythronate dehydrogenase [Bacteroidaceae bacterium]|nr:4-phosphoerythronate dehydrogenase [Bacteroidaceae bacterium]